MNHPTAGQRRFMLKQATATAHSALDRAVNALDLADPLGYLAFLEASASALLPLEQLLADSDVEILLPDWSSRRRSDHLRTDLAILGGVHDYVELDRHVLTPPETLGVLYVLEGSRLGAQVIVERLPADVPTRRYLSASDTKLWLAFLRCLESPSAPWDDGATIAAARWAFTVFQHAFRVYGANLQSALLRNLVVKVAR